MLLDRELLRDRHGAIVFSGCLLISFTSSARPADVMVSGRPWPYPLRSALLNATLSGLDLKDLRNRCRRHIRTNLSRIAIVIITKCKHHSGSFAEFAGYFD